VSKAVSELARTAYTLTSGNLCWPSHYEIKSRHVMIAYVLLKVFELGASLFAPVVTNVGGQLLMHLMLADDFAVDSSSDHINTRSAV